MCSPLSFAEQPELHFERNVWEPTTSKADPGLTTADADFEKRQWGDWEEAST